MNHNHQHHRERRARLIAEMRKHSGGGLAAIPTAPEAIRNADTHYPYRPDSHFYYLSGFPEPEAVVVLLAGPEQGNSKQVLFCRDKNPEREIWDGFRYGPDAAREIFGFDEACSITDLSAKLAAWSCTQHGTRPLRRRSTRCVTACAPALRCPTPLSTCVPRCPPCAYTRMSRKSPCCAVPPRYPAAHTGAPWNAHGQAGTSIRSRR